MVICLKLGFSSWWTQKGMTCIDLSSSISTFFSPYNSSFLLTCLLEVSTLEMKEDDIKSVKGRWWFDRCTWLKESYESNEMIWLWYGDK